MRFSHKIAIVTGGSTGIGKETIARLSSEGAKVYNLDVVKRKILTVFLSSVMLVIMIK